jgi:hypothetical protein
MVGAYESAIPFSDMAGLVVYGNICSFTLSLTIPGQRFDESKSQHQENVNITRRDINEGTEVSLRNAELKMAQGNGRMVRHAVLECDKGINRETAKPVRQEQRVKQRKIKESIVSYQEELKGKNVLNQCYILDEGWKCIIKEDYNDISGRPERRN